MTARYIQRGESMDYTPDHDIAAGEVVKIGQLVGVAKLDIKAGELGAIALVGVYQMKAANEMRIETGAPVFFDPKTKICSATMTGNPGAFIIGYAFHSDGCDVPGYVCVRLSN